MVAVVAFPPNGVSQVDARTAKYAGCREGEARCDDLAPRVHLEWQNAKKRLSCRVLWLAETKGKEMHD